MFLDRCNVVYYKEVGKKEKMEEKQNQQNLKAQYDLGAIKNSIKNIFVTFPGQKLLNPTFGLNLMQFLFLPISEVTANLIGQRIVNGIGIVNMYFEKEDIKMCQLNNSATLSTFNICYHI